MAWSLERLLPLLVCPSCTGSLEHDAQSLRCLECGKVYPIVDGVPVLVHEDSIFHGTELSDSPKRQAGPLSAAKNLLRRYAYYAPELGVWIDETLFRHLNRSSDNSIILNLGSGRGTFEDKISPHIRMINLDVYRSARTHLIADGHFLPFADDSIDGVFSNAVLEHVQKPWVVADEIYRVLRPGGLVFVNVPFLNVIHDTNDYFRFTDKGLDVIFERFQKLASGVSAGPSAFFGAFLVNYLLCFVPGRYVRALFRPLLYTIAAPLKYADYPIRRAPELRVVADAFYFVGIKPHA
jgi:uncharacterized protein YbaR (Trm112 family)/SAM-dependent methyltransferase